MEIDFVGRNVQITDRFREYATEKAEKIAHLADRSLALEIRVSRHHSKPFGAIGGERVELTLVGPGPLVRAESTSDDKYSAFDVAYGRLLERVRRAKDKQKVHRGLHRTPSVREAAVDGLKGVDITPADVEVIEQVATGSVPVQTGPTETNEETIEQHTPIVIRTKTFPSELISADDAVGRMELLGHDFFVFIDSESRNPSVVYRRKGWDYGVISLETPK